MLTTLPPSCADCLEIWEPQPPGALMACLDFIYLQIFPAFHKIFFLLPSLSVVFLTFPLSLVLKLISLPLLLLSSLISSYCSFRIQFLPTDPSVSFSPLTYPLFLLSSLLV